MQEYFFLNFKETYALNICKNRLSEAILTNIQNTCLLENNYKTISFLYINMLINYSLQQQIHFNGNVFANKCCRCNEGSLYPGFATSAKHSLSEASKEEQMRKNNYKKKLHMNPPTQKLRRPSTEEPPWNGQYVPTKGH